VPRVVYIKLIKMGGFRARWVEWEKGFLKGILTTTSRVLGEMGGRRKGFLKGILTTTSAFWVRWEVGERDF
jgi:hypothetical protein